MILAHCSQSTLETTRGSCSIQIQDDLNPVARVHNKDSSIDETRFAIAIVLSNYAAMPIFSFLIKLDFAAERIPKISKKVKCTLQMLELILYICPHPLFRTSRLRLVFRAWSKMFRSQIFQIVYHFM